MKRNEINPTVRAIAWLCPLVAVVFFICFSEKFSEPDSATDHDIAGKEVSVSGDRPSTNHSFEATPDQESRTLLPADKAQGTAGSVTFRIPLETREEKESGLASGAALKPRKPLPKEKLRLPPGKDIQVTIKFSDELQARVQPGGSLSLKANTLPKSLAEFSLKYPVTFRPVFDPATAEKLTELKERAAQNSGNEQPDFEGTVIALIPDSVKPEERFEIAQAFQKLPQVEYVELESLDQPPPPPGDIAPTTPDITHLQGYRNSESAAGGVNANYAFSRNFKGQGIRFSDCEYGYNAAHEDLVDSDITDSSNGPVHASVAANGWDRHGTAVLGIGGATENAYGVTGIASEAEIHFYSEWTTAGGRRTAAVTDAIADSGFGDVVLLEMQTTGANGEYGPAEYSSTIWNLVKAGTDAGVIVVAAAGNGNEDMNSAAYNAYHARGDSGAIIIGAGSNNSSHTKLGFSTHGDRVNVQAWGTSVYSTGYGSYATYGDDFNQRYTRSFNGTSSASAIAGPSVTAIQSFCEQALGYRLGPIQMRDLLELTGVEPSSEQNIGPHVNIRNAIEYFAPPTNITASDDQAGRINVTWNAAANATSYRIYRADSDSTELAEEIGNTASLAFSDTDVPTVGTHWYFVRPVTPFGDGEWSAPDSGIMNSEDIDLTFESDTGASDFDNITGNNTPTIAVRTFAAGPVTVSSDISGQIGSADASGPGVWPVTVSTLPDGVHTITASSGGDPVYDPLVITIDTEKPSVFVTRDSGQASNAAGGPFHFTINIPDNPGGFDSTDILLSGTASPAGLSLSGGPDTYNATVSSIANEGDVRLTVKAGAIIDLAGNESGETDSGVSLVIVDYPGETPISLDENNDGTVSAWVESGDSDLYTFDVVNAIHMTIETTGTPDTVGILRNAEGQVLNSPVADDDLGQGNNFRTLATLGQGRYFLEVTSKEPAASGAYDLIITAGDEAISRPDLHVGRSLTATRGDGIFGTMAGQIQNITSKKARKVTGFVVLENAGDIEESFKIRGSRGNKYFKVSYYSATGNVTGGLIFGYHSTGLLTPESGPESIRVVTKPNKRKLTKKTRRGKKLLRKKLRLTFRANSIGGSFDVGQLKISVK